MWILFLCPQGRVLLTEKGIPLGVTDIVASNGIIHIIDGLLVPPSIVPIMPHRCDVNMTTIITVFRKIWNKVICIGRPF